jgi:hypothetical protein
METVEGEVEEEEAVAGEERAALRAGGVLGMAADGGAETVNARECEVVGDR